MLLIKTYVAPSPIAGVGVFAAEPAAKGDRVWRLDPEFDRILPMTMAENAPPHLSDYFDRYAYPNKEDPSTFVLEIDNGRFVNHSDSPNVDFSLWGSGFALADIAAGEELTCDYADFFEDYELSPPAFREDGPVG